MISTITFSAFHDAFKNCGRGDSFTYQGYKALFEYLESLENDCDMSIELDPIAFCCEYVEYSNLEDLQREYQDIETIEQLHNQTSVIEFNNGSLIIVAF